MFCRIEFLERDVHAKKRVVSIRYRSAANLGEMLALADRECRARGATGYRWRNLHTDEVAEVWDAPQSDLSAQLSRSTSDSVGSMAPGAPVQHGTLPPRGGFSPMVFDSIRRPDSPHPQRGDRLMSSKNAQTFESVRVALRSAYGTPKSEAC